MLNFGASLKFLAFLAWNLASTRVVDALAPLDRIQLADGPLINERALAHPVAAYNPISLKRQAEAIGSWSLLSGTCPEGTEDCLNMDDATAGKPCCPSGTTCFDPPGGGVNCCPNGKLLSLGPVLLES